MGVIVDCFPCVYSDLGSGGRWLAGQAPWEVPSLQVNEPLGVLWKSAWQRGQVSLAILVLNSRLHGVDDV